MDVVTKLSLHTRKKKNNKVAITLTLTNNRREAKQIKSNRAILGKV